CLAKDPDERWQSAGDLARELRWILEGKPAPMTAPALAARAGGRRREAIAWVFAGVLLVAALALAFRPRPQASEKPPTTRFSITPANGQVEGAPVLSPDGRHVVYALSPETGSPALWLHSLVSGEARLVPGTDGARQP